jgi:hypothetical protein
MMVEGALAFAPLIQRYLGESADFGLSSPFAYAVHRGSLLSADRFASHLNAVQGVIEQARGGRRDGYLGGEIAPPRRMTRTETQDIYADDRVEAVFQTSELAIDAMKLAHKLRTRIAAEPDIELRLGSEVSRVDDDGTKIKVTVRGDEVTEVVGFDHVINALWDGRLAIDAALGDVPDRQWLYRLKYGVRFTLPPGEPLLPSVTVVLGPFGDAVRYGDGAHYISWYPAGMLAKSSELSPPDWPTEPTEDVANRILAESFVGLSAILPQLNTLDLSVLREVRILGGPIFAWGSTDIDDRASVLHRRHEIGIMSRNRYHSIDTGKLTMAPYFSAQCAARVASSA